MLLLDNEEIASLLTIETTMDALEAAYRKLAAGQALNTPRTDALLPTTDGVFGFKQMGGGMVDDVFALRVNADVIRWPEIDGARRRVKQPAANGRYVGLLYLFSSQTGLPLAVMPDGEVQHFRVAATTGLAARYLKPERVETAALLGTGWQAETQLLALDVVLRPTTIRVFSPSPTHRETFVARMQPQVRATLAAVADPDAAVAGCQAIFSATNALQPTILPHWVRDGMLVTTVKPQEVDAAVLASMHRTIWHTRDPRRPVIYALGNAGEEEKRPGWWSGPEVEALPQLVDLIAGREPGRQSANERLLFVNNIGLGIQFAAVGALAWRQAVAQGLGRTLPDEWFTESRHP